MNKIIVTGRLTKDCAINTSGKVATNCIAVDRSLKDSEGKKVTDFINLKWLGEKKSEFALRYMLKGTKVAIEGELNIDNYKDRDGNSKSMTYIMVSNSEFLESKAASGNTNNAPAPSNTANTFTTDANGFMSIPDGIDGEFPFN